MIFQRLRSETASHHAAIESQMPLLASEHFKILPNIFHYWLRCAVLPDQEGIAHS